MANIRRSLPLLQLVVVTLLFLSPPVKAKGGGSKRTFGSQKSSAQNQNLGNCSDSSASCPTDATSDTTWIGASSALLVPLLILLVLIATIKCFTKAYPKGYFINNNSNCEGMGTNKTVNVTVAA